MSYLFSRIKNIWWQFGISMIMITFSYKTISDFNFQASNWRSSDISLMKEVKMQAKNDDYFILYGLTNVNINYYARRFEINNNKIYFPSTMTYNRNTLGPIQELLSNQKQFSEELLNLKNILLQTNNGRFFVFLTNDNSAPIIINFLDSNLKRAGEIIPKEPHMPTWINGVIIYEKY
jgi:hypothetical protein